MAGDETRGDAYLQVHQLNEYLHQAQRKLRSIQSNLAARGEQTAGGMDMKFEYRLVLSAD